MHSPIPEIYVIWHPDCRLGAGLARALYAWLRPGNGLGPNLYYRCLADPAAGSGLPPLLPSELSPPPAPARLPTAPRLEIALLLIDCNMIADAGWRHWLARLGRRTPQSGSRIVLPVALDPTAYNVPESLAQLNFLRPLGLPPPGAGDETVEAARVPVERSLLKQLTETLCWLLLDQSTAAGAAPAAATDTPGRAKVAVFLSHAKEDGTGPARRIRDYIYSKTQLAAFFDENDIPFGAAFSEVLRSSLTRANTAALIAVRSAQYAKRPWCRRELSVFRRPARLAPQAGLSEHWSLPPLLVVDALAAGERTVGIPELGNTPIIRWRDDVPDHEQEIVTTLLRDAVLAEYHSRLGRYMGDRAGRIILNWVPDPTTLLHIPAVRDGAQPQEILHPGRGLSGLELDILSELFPRLRFRSFEQE